jgi:hypothetical protein
MSPITTSVPRDRNFLKFGTFAMQCVFLGLWGVMLGCSGPTTPSKPRAADSHRQLASSVEARIEAFCSDCHAMPDPASFPKSAWNAEVSRGYDFYYASGSPSLELPVFADTLQYFVTRAPEKLQLAAPDPVDSQWLAHAKQTVISVEGLRSCAVSFIDVVDLGLPLGRGILFSDMSGGGVYFSGLTDAGQATAPVMLANVGHPAAIRLCDWDSDGYSDLMIADLGSFLPEDHQRGRVVWLRQDETSLGSFVPTTLQDSVGRVASIEIADFDSDGNDDLLVAEFGWQTTGSIFWLQRAQSGQGKEALTKHQIDSRSGTIHLPTIDINGDGNMDFIALISQHHERIEAMINDGQGQFRSELIYAAPEPAYGSSGIELVDMDHDGQLDILYTNGDSFDSLILKPSHGVRWLSNPGEFPFQNHEIGKLPGAHRALVGDFNGDGQQDLAAGAFFAKDAIKTQNLERTEGLVIWTTTASRELSKHVLSTGDCTHAAMCVADLNQDGCDELIVGEFRETSETTEPAFTVWEFQ